MNNREIQTVGLPGPGEIAVSAGKAFAKSPKAQSFAALWIFGLFCALYAAAPYPTTQEQRAEFESILAESESVPGYDAALDNMLNAREELYRNKGWFTWMSSEASARVSVLQAKLDKAELAFAEVDAKREKIRQQAYGVVGLWSEFGVSEARHLFWDCLEKGKGFAKRATFWDMLFGMTMGRDENIGAFLFRVAINFAINVTIGLIGVIVAFVYYLWGLVVAYQASALSGLAFFAVALLAGLSVAALYIFVIYGTIIGGGYLVVRAAVNAQIENQRAGRQPQQVGYGRRPHYD